MRDIYEGRSRCVHGKWIDTGDCIQCEAKLLDLLMSVSRRQKKDKPLASPAPTTETHYREQYEAAIAEVHDARKTIDGLLATITKLKETAHA